jgi:hypothetical protein
LRAKSDAFSTKSCALDRHVSLTMEKNKPQRKTAVAIFALPSHKICVSK